MLSNEPSPGINRRNFIKTFVILSATSSALKAPWTGVVLGDIRPTVDDSTAVLKIKVSDFAALGKAFGSVRISTSVVSGTNNNSIFPVLFVNRDDKNQYFALNAACTHEDCILPIANATTRITQCRCHNSRFAFDGTRISGPASAPLQRFVTRFDGVDTLTIEVPDRGFSVTSSALQTAPGRVKLNFLGFQNIEYEVLSRPSLDAPWQNVSFALTEAGPLDQTSFKGKDDFADLFVVQDAGTLFFAVSMKLRQV